MCGRHFGGQARHLGGVTYADADKELVEVDVAVAVQVEELHEGVSLGAADSDLDLAETAPELLSVDLFVTVERVEVSEGSAEATDGLSTSGLDLGTDVFENYSECKQLLTHVFSQVSSQWQPLGASAQFASSCCYAIRFVESTQQAKE